MTAKTPDAGQAPPPETDGLPVVACWGDRCLKGRLLSESARDPLGRFVELVFDSEELLRDPPDFLVPVRVWLDPELGVPENQRLRFGGYVLSMEPRDEASWIVRAHNVAKWAEAKGGGIGVKAGTDRREVVWSVARDQGTPPEKIHMPGWNPLLERFLVAIPVEGIEPKGELDTGGMGITRDPDVPKRWIGLGPGDLQAAFIEPQFWAVTWAEARTLWDAEQTAARQVERVIGRVVLAARYSLAAAPGGKLRSFRRRRHLEQVRLRPIAGVEGMQTHRKWLRGYGRSQVDSLVDNGVIESVDAFIGTNSEQVDEAIHAWRRATRERDPSAAVVALGEALEFYAAGTKPSKLFTRAELRAIQQATASAFAQGQAERTTLDERAEEKAKRLEEMVSDLNSSPFSTKLKAALEADGVRCTPSEFALLDRLRGLRNKIVHGEERRLPGVDELEQAIGLVNRALMHRLSRLRAQEGPPRASGKG